MRTAQKWLALPDDKLAVELGRVFTPEPWKHCLSQNDSAGVTICCCSKCDKQWYVDDFPERKPCSVPDPIKLDWKTAMYWFRQHSPSRTILRQVCGPVPIDCISWFLVTAQPKHYLITAAMAVERNKE